VGQRSGETGSPRVVGSIRDSSAGSRPGSATRHGLTAGSWSPDPAGWQLAPGQLGDPTGDRGRTDTGSSRHQGDPTVAKRGGLAGQVDPLAPFIEMRKELIELRPQSHDRNPSGHTRSHTSLSRQHPYTKQ
jgi:hypothetical protein